MVQADCGLCIEALTGLVPWRLACRRPPRPSWGLTGWALPWDGLEPEPRAPGGPGGAQDRWGWASLWQGACGLGRPVPRSHWRFQALCH